MAQKTIANRIIDSGISWDNGMFQIKKVFVVTGMALSADLLTNALIANQIPAPYSYHPIYPLALAMRYDVQPIITSNGLPSNNSAEVVVTYECRQPLGGMTYTIEMGTSLMEVQNDTDIYGDPLEVLSSSQIIKNLPNSGHQRASVSKYVRIRTLTYTHWFVTKSGLSYPTPVETLQDTYQGTVNSKPFRGGIAHDWMCTQISGSTEDYGNSYTITIILERMPTPPQPEGSSATPGGWDQWAYYTDFTGNVLRKVDKSKVIGDPNQYEGATLVNNQYEEADFNSIGEDLLSLTRSAL